MGLKIRFICGIILTASASFASAHDVSCEEMTKTYFLTEMPNSIGRFNEPRKERPEMIKRLMFRVKLNYPDKDMLACINQGLKDARASKGIYLRDTLHGGVDDMQ